MRITIKQVPFYLLSLGLVWSLLKLLSRTKVEEHIEPAPEPLPDHVGHNDEVLTMGCPRCERVADPKALPPFPMGGKEELVRLGVLSKKQRKRLRKQLGLDKPPARGYIKGEFR